MRQRATAPTLPTGDRHEPMTSTEARVILIAWLRDLGIPDDNPDLQRQIDALYAALHAMHRIDHAVAQLESADPPDDRQLLDTLLGIERNDDGAICWPKSECRRGVSL